MSVLDDADEVLSQVPSHLLKASDPTREAEIIRLSDRLARKLQSTVKEAEENAVDAILSGRFDQASLQRRIEQEIAKVGADGAEDLSSAIFDANEEIVIATKRVMGKRLSTDRAITDADRRFLDWVSGTQERFLRSGYVRMGLLLAALIVDQAKVQNWSRTELSVQLADQFRLRSKAYAEVVASVASVRARSWAQLSTFMDAGVAQWQFHAVMDGLTCFPAEQLILMANGRKKELAKIKVGDEVVSCYGRPGTVERVGQSWTKRWMRMSVQGHAPVRPTYNHLFLTDKGWIRAERLRVGDKVAQFVPASAKPGAAANLWSDERDWLGRLGRMDPRVINVAPWPHSMLHKIGSFAEVTEVEKLWEHGANHDIEVKGDHGYTVNGLIVHNSEGCMFLHGQVFSVAGCHDRMVRAMDDDTEEAVREAMPFLQKAITEDGEQFLYFKQGEERVRVATLRQGRYHTDLSSEELERAGLPVPPLHPHCRSDLLPVL